MYLKLLNSKSRFSIILLKIGVRPVYKPSAGAAAKGARRPGIPEERAREEGEKGHGDALTPFLIKKI